MTQSLFIQKLLSSGLTQKDARSCRVSELDCASSAALGSSFRTLPAMRFDYFSADGCAIGDPQFFRLRYLVTPKTFSEKKIPKYVQAPKTGVHAYFPRNADWSETLKPKCPLYITEGELKAIKANKEGFPTIGLGGVYSFQSARQEIAFLPELNVIDWRLRPVYIIYDSDIVSNPQVCTAVQKLAEQLELRGAFPWVVVLPSIGGDEKIGLDDFLCEHPAKTLRNLIDTTAISITRAKDLWRLNDELAVIENISSVIHLATKHIYSAREFRNDSRYAAQWIAKRELRSDAKGYTIKNVIAAKEWFKWPLRHSLNNIVYSPGLPKITKENDYNIWSGWAQPPKRGDVSLFKALVDHLFRGNARAKRWFLQWCAYPIQYPGTKLYTAVVLYGVKQGTGKSLLGLTIGQVYGKNFEELKPENLHASFNEWAVEKQFVLGDEVTGSDKRADADMLKKLITQEEVRVNRKYMASYTIVDCINYLFTTNQPNAFFLDNDDRRFFIHEITEPPLPSDFFDEYDLWYRTPAAAAALLYYFQHLELGDFNPRTRALQTMGKDRMIQATKSDLGSWVHYLHDFPDDALQWGSTTYPLDLYPSSVLCSIYNTQSGLRPTSVQSVVRELSRQGFEQVLGGSIIKSPRDGKRYRYFIVRNHKKWHKANRKQVMQHLKEDS